MIYQVNFLFVFQQENDEVLAEIKRVSTELSALAEFNHNELTKLNSIARGELQRLEIKRKLDIIDQEVSARFPSSNSYLNVSFYSIDC